jgi:hypothetical protein
MRFASGTPLAGRYLLLDEIAGGPQAAVWRGLDDVLGRPVAVKLYLGVSGDDRARAWVHARARTAARLNHPHATAVYDYGDAISGGELVPYVVMELLDGQPLAERLAAEGPLPWYQAARVTAEVAAALAASHARGVVHGNVDPGAVMLTHTGAKLLGLAGPGHPPPRRPTAAGDVHGLGLLLLGALCGATAGGSGTWSVARGSRTGEPAEDAALRLGRRPDLPDPVREVCLSCLSAAGHPALTAAATARALTAEVNRYAAVMPDAPLLVPLPAPAGGDRVRPARRWPTRVHTALAAAGIVVLLAASGVAARYGGDLIAAATGTPTPGHGSATGGRQPGSSQARPGTPSGGGSGTAASGTATAGPATPLTGSGPPPAGTPTATAQTPAASAGNLPDDATVALADLRTGIDEGRAAGEIAPTVAAELDDAVDDLAQMAAAGQNVQRAVAGLQQRIDGWVRARQISPARGEQLRAELEAFADSL